MDRQKSNYITSLRGVGAICIVIYHYSCIFSNTMKSKIDWGLLTFAVPMFFVLSAFFLYKKARDFKSVIKLFIYRMLRLYPAYWMGVTITFIIRKWFLHEESINIFSYIANLTMFENILGIEAMDGVYWTLVYEIALLGMLMGFIIVGKILQISIINHCNVCCLIWLLLGFCSQIYILISGHGSSSVRAILFGSSYIPTFVIGLILSDIYLFNKQIDGWMIFNIGLSLIYEIVFMPKATAIIAIIGATMVWLVVSGKYEKVISIFLKNKVLLFFGSISYPIYLCHRYIGEVFAPISLNFTEHREEVCIILLCFSFVVASCCAVLISKIEKKANAFLNKTKFYKWVLKK